jgi:hypothetical protein
MYLLTWIQWDSLAATSYFNHSDQESKVIPYNVQSSFTAEINHLAPPVTECLVDANLPGGLYERMATTGGSIKMSGTTVISIASKHTTMAENSTEAETAAALFLGMILRWLVFFMSDLGLPFQGPIPIITANN